MDVLRHWLAFNRSRTFSTADAATLLARGIDPVRLFADPCAELERLQLAPASVPACIDTDWTSVDADLAWLRAAPERHALPYRDPRYPPALREIAVPPPVLFVDGDPHMLALPQVAIVGSRQPTPYGIDNAWRFARDLGRCGLALTSGLAMGIDAAAHRGALDAGAPTIAVMATGPDSVYPRANRDLARRIAGHGALVSEFPVGTKPLRHHFPRRNRLISGLALGVLVVEAKLPSGSLTTARHALEQGREVFAIPGAIGNPLARGCHALLREGAVLTENATDILVHVAPQLVARTAADAGAAGAVRDAGSAAVIAAIGHESVHFDTIVTRSRLTAPEVSSILSALEIQGEIAAMPGARYACATHRALP
jgi:DNA processing protein